MPGGESSRSVVSASGRAAGDSASAVLLRRTGMPELVEHEAAHVRVRLARRPSLMCMPWVKLTFAMLISGHTACSVRPIE